MNVAHPGSIHHVSLFEKYGQYDTTYKIAGDYELMLRAKGELKAGFIDLVVLDMGMEGVSNTMIEKVLKESFFAKLHDTTQTKQIKTYITTVFRLAYFAFCF